MSENAEKRHPNTVSSRKNASIPDQVEEQILTASGPENLS
jgi:hypothetical protein